MACARVSGKRKIQVLLRTPAAAPAKTAGSRAGSGVFRVRVGVPKGRSGPETGKSPARLDRRAHLNRPDSSGDSARDGGRRDGHRLPTDGGPTLRRPAWCLLRQAGLSWLAAPVLVRGVAGGRPAATGPCARTRADHGDRCLLSERERAVRVQCAVSPRYLDCCLEEAPAASGPRDDLLPHRRDGNSRFPPYCTRRLRADLPDRGVGTDSHRSCDPPSLDERTRASGRRDVRRAGRGCPALCCHGCGCMPAWHPRC